MADKSMIETGAIVIGGIASAIAVYEYIRAKRAPAAAPSIATPAPGGYTVASTPPFYGLFGEPAQSTPGVGGPVETLSQAGYTVTG